jgi:predicted O-methyltransferase YrrM
MVVKLDIQKYICYRKLEQVCFLVVATITVISFLTIETYLNYRVNQNLPYKLLKRPPQIRTYTTLNDTDLKYFSKESAGELSKITIFSELVSRLNFSSLFYYSQVKVDTILEIGVRNGYFAYELLRRWPQFKHYYGVDAHANQSNYLDTANKNMTEQNKDYENALSLLTKSFGEERVTLIRRYSADAADLFQNESICFVYVDGRHDYCGVAEDLNIYYSKVRCGGIFAGHDIQYSALPSKQDWDVCGNGSRIEGSVKKAVAEFALRNNISKIYTTQDQFWRSWYIFKGC